MRKTEKARCHCGAVEIEAVLKQGEEHFRRCNCSLCRRKGAVMAAVALEDLRIVKGEDNLSLYQWNTGVAKHYFCKTCGIYTHHQRRSNPNEFGVNTGCLENYDLTTLRDVPTGDGAAMSVVEAD